MERITIPIKDYFDENPRVRKIMTIVTLVVLLVIMIAAGIYSYSLKGFLDRTILSLVDGLALSMLLFLMVSGFFLIFGLCDVINFAHGAFFMLGGFMGFTIYLGTEGLLLDLGIFGTNYFFLSITCFIVAALGATAVLAVIGGGIEFFTIRRLYGNPIAQILLTVGFMVIITQAAEIIWGSPVLTYFIHTFSQAGEHGYFFITGYLDFGGILVFQSYRIFLIFLGLGIAALMFIAFKKTRIGLQIQAGIEDSEMVEALGTNIKRLFTVVFMLGAGLAGLSGAVLVPWIGANTGSGLTYLIYAFVIVVVGGAHYGRFEGTFFGALIVGFAMKFCAYFIPELQGVIVFIIMVIILIFKPGGLTGR